MYVRVAQWIARRTSMKSDRNPEVVGSNPTVDAFCCSFAWRSFIISQTQAEKRGSETVSGRLVQVAAYFL